jgi:hypothetical protein
MTITAPPVFQGAVFPRLSKPSGEPGMYREGARGFQTCVVVRLAVPWFLAGMLLGASVLLANPPDRLTQRSIDIAAVSIGLDAAWVWLC